MSESDKRTRMSRRSFLRLTGVVGVGLLGSACTQAPAPSPTAAPAKPAAPAAATAPAAPAAKAATAAKAAPTTAAAPAPATKSGPVQRKGVIVQGDDIVSLDPRKQRGMHNEVVIMAACEKLLRMSKANYGTLEGLLATKWEPVGETKWRFNLRQGVKFHNGVEFTSESVKVWLDLYREEALSKDRTDAIEKIEVVDKHTVDFITKYPYALLPYQLNAVAQLAEPGWAKGPQYNENKVIGTGSYKVVEWAKGQYVRFEINPEWWGWKGDLSGRYASLDFRPISEASTRVAALLAGEASIIREIPSQDVERVKGSRGSVVEPIDGNRCMSIRIRDDIPPTNDVRVRQALNYAVDVDAIVKTIHGGFAKKLPGQSVGSTVVGYNPDLKPYPYDPEKAKQLLREAGYPNGFDIKFDTSKGRYAKDLEVSNAIAGMLAKVGVRAEVIVNETAEYAAKYARTRPENNMFFWASGNIVPEVENAFNDLLVRPGQKELTTGFHNKELEKIQEELKRTLDPKRRLALGHAGMKIVHEEAALIFLYQQGDIYGRREEVDWKARPDEWILVDEIKVRA